MIGIITEILADGAFFRVAWVDYPPGHFSTYKLIHMRNRTHKKTEIELAYPSSINPPIKLDLWALVVLKKSNKRVKDEKDIL